MLGRNIEFDRRQFTVIGVMPAGFQFPIQADPIDFYVTIAEDAANPDGNKPLTEERGNHSLEAVARLKAGVTIKQAQADLSTIAASLEKQYRDSNSYFGVAFKPLARGTHRRCAHSPLRFVRRRSLRVAHRKRQCRQSSARARVGPRKRNGFARSHGREPVRIVRQLLTESLLLAGLGGLLGLLIAQWGTEALIRTVPQNIPRISNIQLDGAVLAFTLIVSLATGLIFGLVPAWQASHVDLNTALKTGARSGTGGEHKHRLRNALVVAEVALALVMLVCAGLLIQSFARLGRVSPGVQTERLLTARIQLPSAAYPKNGNMIAFFDQFLSRIRALPGVELLAPSFRFP